MQTIYVVEDDKNIREIESFALKNSGYTIFDFECAKDFYKKLAERKPDLILLDYEMPVCNGKQVLEMIRSDRKFNDTPVIFLTNKVDKDSVKKALALRPEGYLSKSLAPETIKKEVDHFFEQKKVRFL